MKNTISKLGLLFSMVIICMLFVFVGCTTNTSSDNESANSPTTTESSFEINKEEQDLFEKALELLEEFDEEQRVQDFRRTCLIMRTLPEKENKFIAELEIVNETFEKYDVEFKYGGYYLKPHNTIYITADGINEYRNKGIYSDMTKLLEKTIYPVLFEKYGYAVESINGITANEIINIIKKSGSYSLNEKKEEYDISSEKWKSDINSTTSYEIKYYKNGLVKSIELPLTINKNYFSDDEYKAYFNETLETQKDISNERFMTMINQLDANIIGYEVLSKIFTNEEINIILNYIQSLTIDEIWDKNLLSLSGLPSTYSVAALSLRYKDKNISISFDLNNITLSILGTNIVNDYSNRWYTLYCGLCLPKNSNETINLYLDCINNNISSNNTIPSFTFNLDENADKFSSQPIKKNEESLVVPHTSEMAIPLYSSITVHGVIEYNDSSFPTYILRLDQKLSIRFTDSPNTQVFNCDYVCFFDDEALNGNYNFEELIGCKCTVDGIIFDYRGGGQLFLESPNIHTDN